MHMVTQLKPDSYSNEPSPRPRARTHEGVPEYSFSEVLHRRNGDDDPEKLRIERLLRWNALGLELEASGWHHLEAALELVRSNHNAATHDYTFMRDPGCAAIPTNEAEQIAMRFYDDCDTLVAAGAQMALWHLLVDDRAVCFETVGDLVAETLQEGDAGELARLLTAARCYALAAVATMTRAEDRRDARLLFLGEKRDKETLFRFAPFAVDNRVDDREERIPDAAYGFATACTNQDRVDALENLAIGLTERERRGNLSPVQRMGLVAWFARCVLSAGVEADE
jgi:hypothetical protein